MNLMRVCSLLLLLYSIVVIAVNLESFCLVVKGDTTMCRKQDDNPGFCTGFSPSKKQEKPSL